VANLIDTNWTIKMDTESRNLYAKRQKTRAEKTQKCKDDNSILPSKFWVEVYQKSDHTSESLQRWLDADAPNILRKFLAKPKQQTRRNKMQRVLDFATARPANAYWFTFWTDVWCLNQNMNVFHRHNLEVILQGFTQVLQREELERRLRDHHLLGHTDQIPHLFSSLLLDKMYMEMRRATQAMDLTPDLKAAMIDQYEAGKPRVSEPSRADLSIAATGKMKRVKKKVVV
jgi:hypothetical protein